MYEDDFIALAPTTRNVTTIELDSRTTTISQRAFSSCTSLTSVTIGDGVTSIGSSAFSGCTSLTTITIPDSVTSIGGYAFSGCSALESLTIGAGVTTIGDKAFYNTTSLTEINFNAKNCSNLSSYNYVFNRSGQSGEGITVTFGDEVQRIPAYLFCPSNSSSYSPKITSVIIGNNVTSIGSSVFYECTSLTSMNYTGTLEQWCNIAFGNINSNPTCHTHSLVIGGEEITELVIPEGVTTIGAYAFNNCDNITSITIPDSVTSIGDYAFAYNGKLTSIIIDNAYAYGQLSETVSSCGYLGQYATTIRVLKSIVDDENNMNDYLNDTANFTREEDESGLYYIYTKA